MASDSTSVQEVREFIYKGISQQLGQADIQGLVYTQDLPPAYLGKSALEVFIKLEMLDRYSVSYLDPLSQMLKRINRNDLAKKVDKFCKSCKSSKKQSSKKDQSVVDAHKHLDYLIDATLEVTKLQTKILLEQIEELKKSVNDRGLVHVEEVVDDAVEIIETTFQSKLSRVSTAVALSRRVNSIDSNDSSASGGPASLSSVTSSENSLEDLTVRSPTATMERAAGATRKSSSLPRDIGKSAHKTPLLPPTPPKKPEQDPSEIVYDEVCSPPPLPSLTSIPAHYYSSVEVTGTNGPEQSHMVTGRDGIEQAKPRPPAIKPKPRVFRKPAASVTDLTNVDSDYSGGSCTDNTGGSYTDYTGDTSTGDSGFVEAKKYLKKPLLARRPAKPHVTPRTYTPIKVEGRDEPDYYKSRTDEKRDEIFGLMAAHH